MTKFNVFLIFILLAFVSCTNEKSSSPYNDLNFSGGIFADGTGSGTLIFPSPNGEQYNDIIKKESLI